MEPSVLLMAEVGALVVIAVIGTAALVTWEWRTGRTHGVATVASPSLPVVLFCPVREEGAAVRLGLRAPGPRTRFDIVECEHVASAGGMPACDRACLEAAVRA